MPYEGEYAGYRSIRRLASAEKVQQLLKRARVAAPNVEHTALESFIAPSPAGDLPAFVVGIDGSYNEVPVKNGYPGAHVGYCTVASVLINLKLINELDEDRPVDPQLFRETEKAATVDAALPGSNVVTRNHTSARDAFREAVFDVLHDAVVDEDDRTRLLETYEVLLSNKPQGRGQSCPYDGCDRHVTVAAGTSACPCEYKKPIYSTDGLRIHERFSDAGTNGEAFGLVSEVWGKVLFVHLLRCFERRGWIDRLGQLTFVLDGPLGVFGPPAWLSAAISAELKRLNGVYRNRTGTDLSILGIEKTGTFVTHFDEIDQTEQSGVARFQPGSYLMLTDRYIKDRISLSDSQKRYGVDTYFGRNSSTRQRPAGVSSAASRFLLRNRTHSIPPTFPSIRSSEPSARCSTSSRRTDIRTLSRRWCPPMPKPPFRWSSERKSFSNWRRRSCARIENGGSNEIRNRGATMGGSSAILRDVPGGLR